MPEGDTVYKVAAYLRTELQGRRLASGRADTPRPVDLAGLQVSDVYARGKHLFIALDDRLLRSHLGMHGSWHRYARGEAWQRSERQAAIVLDTGED
ncbi:MAG: formamidopyrimidine DNA glycosylase, partial [Gammaproteobacteria bacterium]|nr:formamidopyrimidine DNA glycosylase [Gammaproteobacteria bacterium]